MNDDLLLSKVFEKYDLPEGRMIAEIKSVYCKNHEGDLIIFNANVITEEHGKIWYGDLNISLDFDNLKNVADELHQNLYILMEGDARFGYENRPIAVLLSKARTVIKCIKCEEAKKEKKVRKPRKTK